MSVLYVGIVIGRQVTKLCGSTKIRMELPLYSITTTIGNITPYQDGWIIPVTSKQMQKILSIGNDLTGKK
jgi:hypothetical protein